MHRWRLPPSKRQLFAAKCSRIDHWIPRGTDGCRMRDTVKYGDYGTVQNVSIGCSRRCRRCCFGASPVVVDAWRTRSRKYPAKTVISRPLHPAQFPDEQLPHRLVHSDAMRFLSRCKRAIFSYRRTVFTSKPVGLVRSALAIRSRYRCTLSSICCWRLSILLAL